MGCNKVSLWASTKFPYGHQQPTQSLLTNWASLKLLFFFFFFWQMPKLSYLSNLSTKKKKYFLFVARQLIFLYKHCSHAKNLDPNHIPFFFNVLKISRSNKLRVGVQKLYSENILIYLHFPPFIFFLYPLSFHLLSKKKSWIFEFEYHNMINIDNFKNFM